MTAFSPRLSLIIVTFFATMCLYTPNMAQAKTALPPISITTEQNNILLHRIKTFRNTYENKPTGLYVEDNTFYAVVSLKFKNNETQLQIKKRSRAGMLKLLRSFFREQEQNPVRLKKYAMPSLKDDIKKFASNNSGSFIMKELSVSVMKDARTNKGYTYAIAGNMKDLYASCKRYSKSINNEDILVPQYLRQLTQSKDYARLASFTSESGEDFMAARLALVVIDQQYFLFNYSQKNSALEQRRADIAIAQNPEYTKQFKLLKQAPANPDIMLALYKTLPDQSPEQHMVALLSHTAFPHKWSRKALTQKGVKSPTQYLLDTPPKANVPNGHVVDVALRGGGALYMDKSFSAQDSENFQKARALFSQGGDLAEIHMYLLGALAQAPANIIAWDYLGAVYKAQGNWRDATAIFRQMLMFDPSHAEAIASYAECIHHLGFKKEAQSMALLAKASTTPDDKNLVEKICNRVLMP